MRVLKFDPDNRVSGNFVVDVEAGADTGALDHVFPEWRRTRGNTVVRTGVSRFYFDDGRQTYTIPWTWWDSLTRVQQQQFLIIILRENRYDSGY